MNKEQAGTCNLHWLRRHHRTHGMTNWALIRTYRIISSNYTSPKHCPLTFSHQIQNAWPPQSSPTDNGESHFTVHIRCGDIDVPVVCVLLYACLHFTQKHVLSASDMYSRLMFIQLRITGIFASFECTGKPRWKTIHYHERKVGLSTNSKICRFASLDPHWRPLMCTVVTKCLKTEEILQMMLNDTLCFPRRKAVT